MRRFRNHATLKDDTRFEKQSALFALAISDIVLINIWCHDIGREHAANKPLLKIVFQVMMRLFSPRKTTLLFVIRDQTKTPLEYLELDLRKDIQKIWSEVAKPEVQKNSPLSDFFNVEVIALSSFEANKKQFKEEVAQLRQRISDYFSTGGRLAGDRQGVVPASGFSFILQQIWKAVKENRDLDLPAHKVMVATVRCEEIANEMLKRLNSDKVWMALKEDVKAGLVPGFGETLRPIIESYLSEYDKESIYFDDVVRNAKRQQLELNALDVVRHAQATMLGHLSSKALKSFKIGLKQSLNDGKGFAESVRASKRSSMSDFDRGCEDASIRHSNLDASEARKKLGSDMETVASSISTSELSELMAKIKKQLTDDLTGPVESVLEAAENNMWPSLRKLVKYKSKDAVSEFSTAVASFELDGSKIDRMVQTLRKHARNVVEKKARKAAAANKTLSRMKDRFTRVFNYDNHSRPRVWTGRENIETIVKDAHSECLKILSIMAAIRLDKKQDNIEKFLSSLMDETVSVPSSRDRSNEAARDPLASSKWEEISPNDTLLTPVLCKSLWERFEAETKNVVDQAISSQ
ncbi:PREDICTED: protein ROOT HAIR DEFECTIVE 3 homolog 2-like, partial [Populus euphratica]|uniref:Protein ROOT HAIR DEFECTIVE 3 homolog 2-like n=1 Tax=Populus euphratica TaxID=75702 RepID=A0AAJ6TQS5_POPEU